MKFIRGTSGNPNGRPKGLLRQLRDEFSKDLPAIMRVQIAIAKGEIPEGTNIKIESVSAADATRAAEFVADRLLGKATQHVEHGGELNIGPPVPMKDLKRDQLEALAALGGFGPDGSRIH